MSRRHKGRPVHGVVLLDKPAGWTSNQALQKVRWLYQARKAGHTGNLDPFATGMLPICLGEASKTATYMLNVCKSYVARARFGAATTTGDIEGETLREMPVPALDADRVGRALQAFEGEIEQTPPMYSALKYQGRPLYELARAGQEVERNPRRVTIHSLELLEWKPPLLNFRVRCSKGTYIRTLAEDIAQLLGCCAHLEALRRLAVEPFHEDDMIGLDELEARAAEGVLDDCLLPVDSGLSRWPRADLDAGAARRFSHGNTLEGITGPIGLARVYGPAERLLGLGEILPGKVLKARRIMNL
jgi:tRNA pseudouridine55 synthase